jgi:hypothetical protein
VVPSRNHNQSMNGPKQRHRAERREYIRTHHPDRGGDSAEFARGLRRWDEQVAERLPRVVVVPSRRWPLSWINVVVRRAKKRRPSRVR